ncbi:hypothetical protein M2202_010046 [Bradyrhizobium japonicum]|jgi:hypothetical protein|nr:hypothetical protein [Bradyrhizobium japonicum]MCP1794667.1 hypothetical protein [Bradyrhizobium japonicum]MCP1811067.1 hypothetical protein [Bradyrhizobium japonicum]MCP1821080.1 hypothetical protein [Bradyrhizobium japonicum]MCP1876116.1 hypothetical protein [Bradyrhizobium japonicum]
MRRLPPIAYPSWPSAGEVSVRGHCEDCSPIATESMTGCPGQRTSPTPERLLDLDSIVAFRSGHRHADFARHLAPQVHVVQFAYGVRVRMMLVT